MKTYTILLSDNTSSTLYIDAENEQEARERAQDLIDNGNPQTLPAYFEPADYKIEDIAEEPQPDEEQRKNAEENADALAELDEA